MPAHAPAGIIRNGTTNDGEIIQAARETPYRMGRVRQPPRRSPSMSAKSFVVVAPSRNSPKIVPMYHGSTPRIVLTVDQPATLSIAPRGIAIVRFAQMPSRLVRNGGTEYIDVMSVAP